MADAAHGGPASTVVDCTGEVPLVLRVGAVPLERVIAILDAAGVRHELSGLSDQPARMAASRLDC